MRPNAPSPGPSQASQTLPLGPAGQMATQGFVHPPSLTPGIDHALLRRSSSGDVPARQAMPAPGGPPNARIARKPVPDSSPSAASPTSSVPRTNSSTSTLPAYRSEPATPLSEAASWPMPPSYRSRDASPAPDGKHEARARSAPSGPHVLPPESNPLSFHPHKASLGVPSLAGFTRPSALNRLLHRKAPVKDAAISAPIAGAHERGSRVLASFDLGAGISTPTMGPLPPMEARIGFDGSAALKGGDLRTKLAIDRMHGKASEALQAAAGELKSELEAFDADMQARLKGRKPTVDELQAFKATCGAILKAQEAKVEQLVQNTWDMERHRDKSLRKSKVKFGVTMAFKGVKMSGSIASAAFGSAPSAVLAAYTAVQMAEVAKGYFTGRDKALEHLHAHDEALAKEYNGKGGVIRGARSAVKELFGATHIPLTHALPTLDHHGKNIEEFLAKSERMRSNLKAWHKEMVQTRTNLQRDGAGLVTDMRAGKLDEASFLERQATLQSMESQLQRCEEKIADMNNMLDADNHRYLYFKHRLNNGFRDTQAPGVQQASAGTSTAVLGADLAYIAYNVAKLAPKISSYAA